MARIAQWAMYDLDSKEQVCRFHGGTMAEAIAVAKQRQESFKIARCELVRIGVSLAHGGEYRIGRVWCSEDYLA